MIDEDAVQTIAKQMEASRKNADFVGSLVVGGHTGRPTEHTKKPVTVVVPPPWWPAFWLTYQHTFRQYTEEEAKALVFKEGRFTRSTLDEAKPSVLALLGGGTPQRNPPTTLPDWNVL